MNKGVDRKELSMMREAIEDLLPDVCNILTVVSTDDGQGGFIWTAGTASVEVPVRADRTSNSVGEWLFSMPHNTTITTKNSIQYNGFVYDVTGVNNDISWPIVKRITVQETSMFDRAVIWQNSYTVDDYGAQIQSWTSAGTVSCQFEMTGGDENKRVDATVLAYDATIRLPLDIEVNPRDKIQVITHYGAPITPIDYGIADTGIRLPSGWKYTLKRIEPSREAE